jgi:hypothetical protein
MLMALVSGRVGLVVAAVAVTAIAPAVAVSSASSSSASTVQSGGKGHANGKGSGGPNATPPAGPATPNTTAGATGSGQAGTGSTSTPSSSHGNAPTHGKKPKPTPTTPTTTTTTTVPAPTPSTTTTTAAPATPVDTGDAPAPVIGQNVVAGPTSGTVSVQVPGGAPPAALTAPTSIPDGSVIDATHGTITLAAVRNTAGAVNTGTFWGAKFVVRHPKGHPGLTELDLREKPTCPAPGQARAADAPAVASLWGHDNHGRFRTRGRNSVATVRGTTWSMTETCHGTVTTVLSGTVDVMDIHTGHVTVITARGAH